MVNAEILESLKSALARGQSLRDSMQSLYNSGYGKPEIEEAAKFHLLQQKQASQMSTPYGDGSSPLMNQTAQSSNPKKVSAYGSQGMQPIQRKAGNLAIILLTFLLIALVGGLVLMILFKEDIVGFFEDLLLDGFLSLII
jgi:hypothetical protein